MSSSNHFSKVQELAASRTLIMRLKMHAWRMLVFFLVAVLGSCAAVATVTVASDALLTGGAVINPTKTVTVARSAPLAVGPVINPTKTDAIINDGVGGDPVDGKADPGEIIEYTVTIPNTGTVPGTDDALGVTFNDTIDPNTTLVGGSLVISPLAFNDTYNSVGNMTLTGASVTGNDMLNGGTLIGFGPAQGTANATVVNGTNSVTTT